MFKIAQNMNSRHMATSWQHLSKIKNALNWLLKHVATGSPRDEGEALRGGTAGLRGHAPWMIGWTFIKRRYNYNSNHATYSDIFQQILLTNNVTSKVIF